MRLAKKSSVGHKRTSDLEKPLELGQMQKLDKHYSNQVDWGEGLGYL